MADVLGLIGLVVVFVGYVAILVAIAFGFVQVVMRFRFVAMVPFVFSLIGIIFVSMWLWLRGPSLDNNMGLLTVAEYSIYAFLSLMVVQATLGWILWCRCPRIGARSSKEDPSP